MASKSCGDFYRTLAGPVNHQRIVCGNNVRTYVFDQKINVIGRQEVRYCLIGFEEPTFSGETALQSLSKRCDFLITERGYDPWDKS